MTQQQQDHYKKIHEDADSLADAAWAVYMYNDDDYEAGECRALHILKAEYDACFTHLMTTHNKGLVL